MTTKLPTDTTPPRFGCPECDSEQISENNQVDVRLRVTSWGHDGEPEDFTYPWKTVDDTITTHPTEKRWHCDDCCHEFEILKPLNDSARIAQEGA